MNINPVIALWLAVALPASVAAFGEETTGWDEVTAQALQSYAEGRPQEALPLAERSFRMARRLFGAHAIRTADTLELLGNIHYARGKLWRALFFYQRASTIHEQVRGIANPKVAEMWMLISELYTLIGYLEEANYALERAQASRAAAASVEARGAPVTTGTRIAASTGAVPATPLTLVSVEHARRPPSDGQAQIPAQQASPALEPPSAQRPAAHAVIGATASTAPPHSKATADTVPSLQPQNSTPPPPRLALLPRGPRGLAARDFGKETVQMRSLRLLAESLIERAVAYIQIGSYRQADQLLQEALTICDRLYGPQHPNTRLLLQPASAALGAVGRPEEPIALEARLRKTFTTAPR